MRVRPSPTRSAPAGPVRCELLLTAPFALVGGGLYGAHLARQAGLSPAGGALAGGCALLAFVALQLALEPAVVARFGGRGERWGAAVAWIWDGVTGTVVGLPLVLFLDLPALPGAGAALTAGAAYGYVMGFVVCGGGAEMAARTLLAGGGIRRSPEHSLAQAHEQRGELDGALAAYREACRRDPADPLPWLGAARVLARQGRAPEALDTLRAALERARLEPAQELLMVQRIVALHEAGGGRASAAPDLARYLDGRVDGPAAAWARDELAAIKAALARRMGLGGDEAGRSPGEG